MRDTVAVTGRLAVSYDGALVGYATPGDELFVERAAGARVQRVELAGDQVEGDPASAPFHLLVQP